MDNEALESSNCGTSLSARSKRVKAPDDDHVGANQSLNRDWRILRLSNVFCFYLFWDLKPVKFFVNILILYNLYGGG